MGQGNSFIAAADTVRQMNEFLDWADRDSTTKDEVFKDFFKYKWAAAIILKNSIPEYKDMHPLRITRLIKDDRERGEQSDEEIMQDEIDLVSGVEGTGVQKETSRDLTFRVYKNEERKILNLITVNFEMQNIFRKEQPNTIARATYYAASKLEATVPAGDTAYANMHKVYTIWLCAENVTFSMMADIQKAAEQFNAKCVYKHRFGMKHFFDDMPAVLQAPEADFMEVVMFDLKVLKNKVDINLADEDEQVLLEVLYDMPKSITHMEKVYCVDLTGYSRKVRANMGLIEKLQNEVEEKNDELKEKDKLIEEQGSELKVQRNLIKEKDNLIEQLQKLIIELQSEKQLS